MDWLKDWIKENFHWIHNLFAFIGAYYVFYWGTSKIYAIYDEVSGRLWDMDIEITPSERKSMGWRKRFVRVFAIVLDYALEKIFSKKTGVIILYNVVLAAIMYTLLRLALHYKIFAWMD